MCWWYGLYSVICAMIGAYFDDENESEELMDMINNETAEETVGKFESEIILENRLAEWEKEVDRANARVEKVIAENVQLKARIRELENQLINK